MSETKFDTVTEAEFVKSKMPLIEGYDHYRLLDCNGAPPIPGKTPQERDFQRAVMAQLLHNTACEALKTRPGDPNFAGREGVDRVFETIREATTPTKTTAWSGATNVPLILGYVRKLLPKMISLRLYQIQPLDRPTGRVYFVERKRHEDGTTDGGIATRAGWSYRSWIDDPGEATSIKKSVTFTMTSADVSVTSHKIQTETSVEVEQDLRAYHGMDAMALISDGATDEMAMELDEVLLHNLYRQISANGAGTFQIGAKPSGYTYEEWDRRILEILERAATHVEVYKRVQPNNLVAGSEWAVQLGRLQGWVPTNEMVGRNLLLRPIGTLASAWDCYKVGLPFPSDQALMVYKGTSWDDASFFYMPYVPLMLVGEDFNPNTMVRTRSWLSRFGIYNADAAQNAYLKINSSITGLSYPAWTEYTG